MWYSVNEWEKNPIEYNQISSETERIIEEEYHHKRLIVKNPSLREHILQIFQIFIEFALTKIKIIVNFKHYRMCDVQFPSEIILNLQQKIKLNKNWKQLPNFTIKRSYEASRYSIMPFISCIINTYSWIVINFHYFKWIFFLSNFYVTIVQMKILWRNVWKRFVSVCVFICTLYNGWKRELKEMTNINYDKMNVLHKINKNKNFARYTRDRDM